MQTTIWILFISFAAAFSSDHPNQAERDTEKIWGQTGHRIVAEVAQNHLTPEAEQAVRELLGGVSMARISVWADEARGKDEWSFTRTWHYTTIPDGETYETAEKQPDGDVITALRKYENVLRSSDATKDEKVTALKFFIHFAGDVHQPLHVGNGEDRGGNDVDVSWYGEKARLHSVWDSDIIEHTELSFTEFTRFIDHATEDQIKDWQDDNYVDWAMESYNVRDQVYSFSKKGNNSRLPYLSWDYRNMAVPIVEKRLLKAGIRLAGILNDIYS